ncbi:MAG: trigger factor [Acidimicrobiia bacterium]|nr:trigger factor [Acidimicrobiia bacterium]
MSAEQECKRTLEFTVSAEEVETETARVVGELQKKVRLPGFRPGKAPASIIRSRFASDIRQEVIDAIVPRVFHQRTERDNLRVVGSPGVTEMRFEKGEPMQFTVEFEVAPEIELGEYRGLTVPYDEPTVSAEEVEERLEQLREAKAEYVNVDPRPVADGDHAVVSLRSVEGVEGDPITNDEMILHIGSADTMVEFNENLLGMAPEEEKEFEVSYPENYGAERLAGKRVKFHVTLKGLRKKELPELNDEFAGEVGDFRDMEELREEVRKSMLADREQAAQTEAKNKLVDVLVEAHQFPVPEAFIERQIEVNLESRIRELAMQGVDPRSLKIDWQKVKESQREPAMRDVKASLLLDRIGDREAIETLTDEVDREIHRMAKQLRETPAALRMRLEKDGSLRRLANRIRTEKVLSFLFENARKVAPELAEEKAEEAAE